MAQLEIAGKMVHFHAPSSDQIVNQLPVGRASDPKNIPIS